MHTVPTVVKKYVNRRLAKEAEVKNVVVTISKPTPSSSSNYKPINPYTIDTACNVLSLTAAPDNISQGVGQGDRVGDQIQVKKLLFKGYIYSLQTGIAPNLLGGFPTNVTMYIGRLKSTLTAPNPSAFGQLFQAGDTTFSPTDDNRSSLYDINKDVWTVFYRRTFKIGGSTQTSANAVSNNDYSALRRFSINCSKWIPKKLHYNDNVITSQNAGLYVWFTISNYNDQPITSAYVPQVQLCALNDFQYTD